MLTRHQCTVTLVFRVILVKVDYRGRENGEEDTESDDDDVTNTRWKGRSATKVGILTLKLRIVSPRWGADVDAFDGDGTSGHDCSRLNEELASVWTSNFDEFVKILGERNVTRRREPQIL